jgi:hypothetical protein
MKNCDSCSNYIKVRCWRDGRKGMCCYTDFNIVNMKGNPCPHNMRKGAIGRMKNYAWT